MPTKSPVLASGRTFNCAAPCLGTLVGDPNSGYWICEKCWEIYEYSRSAFIPIENSRDIQFDMAMHQEEKENDAYLESVEREIYETS